MRIFGLLIGAVVMVAGATTLAAPDQFLALMRSLMTPAGLYAIAAGRIAIGLVFVLGAPASRAPRVLRWVGLIVIIAGLVTPFFGVARSESVLNWWAGVGPMLKTIDAVAAMALGAFIVYAFSTRRQINRSPAQ
jgi:energy-coupling factor transporter transmembrane protein EcfT